ncbi:MAG: GIY-YIG nuclease family protein [Candidatus Cloacimonetes bacterium]|nr:GIY-YIG nuclease family protein [Candidatus Cloacimonadota bacterium]
MNYSYVYILSDTQNQTLYIGVTSNLIKRITEHKNHLHDGFTKKYNVTKLVYYEEFLDIRDAINREKTLKGKLRKKKLNLILTMNPYWLDLYDMIINEEDMTEFSARRDKYMNLLGE